MFRPTLYRAGLVFALAGALWGCASRSSYRSSYHKGDYNPPGPPSDPWGPYIREASLRFQVPEQWVRAVMRQESGGRLYGSGGGLITSSAGAMGLMQVMPETYDGLRARYDLGEDPYDPHNSILAGTAYVREMYDRYGAPGFLAAYNAGPRRLDRYLAGETELPGETVNYLASVAPRLGNAVAMTGPLAAYGGAGSRGAYAPVEVASLPPAASGRAGGRGRPAPIVVARMDPIASPGDPGVPVPVAARMDPVASPGDPGVPMPMPVQVAAAEPVAAVPSPGPAVAERTGGFHLISPAAAATLTQPPPALRSPGGWAIQVGAYALPSQARSAADAALASAAVSPSAQSTVGQTVRPDGAVLYRARVTGLTGSSADGACRRLRAYGRDCMVVPPQGAS